MEAVDWEIAVLPVNQRIYERIGTGFGEDAGEGGVATGKRPQ